MRPGRTGSEQPAARRWGARRTIVAAVAIVLVVLLLPSLAQAAAPAWADPPSWGNGVVFCAFESDLPGLTASPASAIGTGLSVQGLSLQERDGVRIVAWADFSASDWTVTNASDEDTFDLEYNASVPVVNATGGVGAVTVGIDFVLPAYSGADPAPANVVVMGMYLAGWPWQSGLDLLVLSVTLAPASSDEHLAYADATGGNVSSVANASGATIGAFLPGAAGTVSVPGSPPSSIAALSSATPNGTRATVTSSFSASGEYRTLDYASHVEINVPSTVAGLPVADYVLVGGAAAVIVAVVGLGGRRIRRRPSDLVFVE